MKHPADLPAGRDLDAALEAPASQLARRWVAALPEDVPNLVARAALGERLAAAAAERRRQRVQRAWRRFGWSFAAAGALGMALVAGVGDPPSGPVAHSAGGFEASLVDAHREAVSAMDVSSATVGETLAARDAASAPAIDWTAADLEAL